MTLLAQPTRSIRRFRGAGPDAQCLAEPDLRPMRQREDRSCHATGWLVAVATAVAAGLHAGAVVAAPAEESVRIGGARAHAECAAHRVRGEREAASSCYRARIAELPPDAHAARAEAYWGLGSLREANDAFRAAVAAAPDDAGVLTRWGELYLDTHQVGDAVALFRDALERAPDHLPAKLGIARARAASFEPGAGEELDAILADAPGYVDAALLRVRLLLEAGNLDEAARALDAVSTQIGDDPSDALLESFALRATLDLLQGRSESDATERALAVHPGYGEIYAIPAHFHVITRRYAEAIQLLDRAVAIQPDLWSAHAELGRNLLRINEFERGRHHIELAYGGDPYDPETVNTLRLLDQLAEFVVEERALRPRPPVSRGGPAPPLALATQDGAEAAAAGTRNEGSAEARVESASMILRMRSDEAAALEPYVRTIVEHAAATFERRYRYELLEPVVIELYPNHDDFAVRTAGMPGLGILGAAFGYVVAMDSPSARGPDEGVHWGSVLWHEIAHVFTLEATDHRVPRWFSEGLSMLEEWETGPQRDRALPASFREALRDGRLLSITDLDQGFVRPMYPGQVGVSYVQAGLVCEHIAATRGDDAIVAMLDGFRRGLSTGAIVEKVLEQEPEAFDAALLAFARQRAGPVLDREDEWEAHRREARKALAAAASDPAQYAVAIEHATQVVALHPDDVAATSGHLLLARAQAGAGDRAAAIAALIQYRARGGANAGALRELAAWLEEAGRRDEAIDVLRALRYIAPLDAALHQRLAEALLDANDTHESGGAGRAAEALTELLVAQALDPIDPVATHYAMARAHRALGSQSLARRQLLLALERAPHFRPAQRMLLELRSEGAPKAPSAPRSSP